MGLLRLFGFNLLLWVVLVPCYGSASPAGLVQRCRRLFGRNTRPTALAPRELAALTEFFGYPGAAKPGLELNIAGGSLDGDLSPKSSGHLVLRLSRTGRFVSIELEGGAFEQGYFRVAEGHPEWPKWTRDDFLS